MAPAVGGVARLRTERIRTLHWRAVDVSMDAILAELQRLQTELATHDAAEGEHPHPRNCVLNLIVLCDDRHRADAADQLVSALAASHPMRAILVHTDGGSGAGTMDAEITSEAHRLLNGFPVQREQVLLHVRGGAADHLASLLEPLLVPDVPTYWWWSGRQPLDEATTRQAMEVSDVIVIDSAHFAQPAGSLVELAKLVGLDEVGIGLADFRWTRLRPWREAMAQFFAPAERRTLLAGLRQVRLDCSGEGPGSRVGGALVAGWLASALGRRIASVVPTGFVTEAVAESGAGPAVRLLLESTSSPHVAGGELAGLRLEGRSGDQAYALEMERDLSGGYVVLRIDMDAVRPIEQRLQLPPFHDVELLLRAVASSRRDHVLVRSLAAAVPLLEVLR